MITTILEFQSSSFECMSLTRCHGVCFKVEVVGVSVPDREEGRISTSCRAIYFLAQKLCDSIGKWT